MLSSKLPNTAGANKSWLHWKKTFANFLTSLAESNPEKLSLLINYVSSTVFEYISDSKTYDSAIDVLKNIYTAPQNEILSRHLLATRIQQPGESLDTYLSALKLLSKDCNCMAVTAENYRKELIRDAFINATSLGEYATRA